MSTFGYPANLPGLALHPVAYGTTENPMNLMYPRGIPTGMGETYFHGARPPWPAPGYGWQHAPIGRPGRLGAPGMLGGSFPTGSLILVTVASYLGYVAAIYAINKAWKLKMKTSTIFLAGLLAFPIHWLVTFIGGYAGSAVFPSTVQE